MPPVENKTIEEEQLVSEDPRLDQRSSDPQRRVLAEEAYGGPIENPPPMDDEIIKKLISSDPSVDEQRLVDSGMDAETAAYFAGGSYSPNSAVLHYDGSSWSAAPSLGTGRGQISGSQASQTAAIVFGGGTSPTPFQSTEEYNVTAGAATTLTTS